MAPIHPFQKPFRRFYETIKYTKTLFKAGNHRIGYIASQLLGRFDVFYLPSVILLGRP